MPIISCNVYENKTYRICISLGNGITDNVVITKDGLYAVCYVHNGISHNHTGKILNIVQNKYNQQNNYILFDWSEDNHNRRERIYFHQIYYIKDITPNNAYQIALEHGFVGSVDDWLESMKVPGKDAYEIAVEYGFEGTREEFAESLMTGKSGLSAYEIAVKNGFEGSEKEWLDSLRGKDGLSAYEIAVKNGFEGSEEEWLESMGNVDVAKLNEDIDLIKDHVTWNNEM